MESNPESTFSQAVQQEEQITNDNAGDQNGQKLQKLYDQGTLFFTKEMLLATRDQMREIRAGKSDVFISKNFLGEPVVFRVKKGVVVGEPDGEWDVKSFSSYGYPSSLTLGSFVFTNTQQIAGQTFQEIKSRDCYADSTDPGYASISICTPPRKDEKFMAMESKTPDETEKGFRRAIHDWHASEDCSKLKSIIAGFMKDRPTWEIKYVAGFAFGALSSKYAKEKWARTVQFQHALLFTLGNTLPGKQKKCFVQDPCYTDVDRLVLGKFNIGVLDDPEGVLKVDSSTVVCSICPSTALKQMFCDLWQDKLQWPPIIIWFPVGYDDSDLR
ncbi:hypothetical protein FQN51_000946 [Onygenales sp. PD_10]|nr:hypothetical protein FQN51_000946 [Onygenales sp. PD_10]